MFDYVLNAFVTLLVTIDPAGLAPIFVALTTGMTGGERRQTALRACVVAACVLLAFALVGQPLIGVLGISLPAFRIAGGLLLFSIAFEMVFGLREERKAATAETSATRHEDLHRVAVFPLAIPLIAGPGAISAGILLASRAPSALAVVLLLFVIVLLIGLCFAVFTAAGRIDRWLGETGRVVVGRVLGLLLAALSVQFVADGILTIAYSGPPPA
jgi:multiple antibiotic resistance protein